MTPFSQIVPIAILLGIIAVLTITLWLERNSYRLLSAQWEKAKAEGDATQEAREKVLDTVRAAEEAKARAESTLERFAEHVQGLLAGLENNERLLRAQALANERICKERDETAEAAHLTALRFGNAQNMLIRALGDILRGYNLYRTDHGDKPIELDQGLQQIMKERDSV